MAVGAHSSDLLNLLHTPFRAHLNSNKNDSNVHHQTLPDAHARPKFRASSQEVTKTSSNQSSLLGEDKIWENKSIMSGKLKTTF